MQPLFPFYGSKWRDARRDQEHARYIEGSCLDAISPRPMTLDDLKQQLAPVVEARRVAYARLTAAERALLQKARETGGVPAVRDLADNVRLAAEEFRLARNAVDRVVFAAPTEVQHQLTAGDLGIT